MDAISVGALANLLNATVQGSSHAMCRLLVIDTRKISFPAETMFIALKSERRNGHQFVQAAWQQGVRMFLVDEPLTFDVPDSVVLTVGNTMTALHQLGMYKRSMFHGTVVGITGSNGKTIVKEWLYEMMHGFEHVVRSPKSFNSQIGVPLSVWLLEPAAALGFFEAGISQPGEMAKLEAVIAPQVGIFTMLGDAHNEGFDSLQQKLDEKFLLFRRCHTLICRTDDAMIGHKAAQFSGTLCNWGFHDGAWLQLKSLSKQQNSTQVKAIKGAETFEWRIPFADDSSIENALHCVAFMLWRGYHADTINQQLSLLGHLDMRLQWKRGIQHCYLLNDSYSNDFTSLTQAMDYLQQQSRHSRRTVILSDLSIPQGSEEVHYRQLAQLLKEKQISRLLGVGPVMMARQPLLALQVPTVQVFESTAALLAYWPHLQFENEDILVKGGRHFAFEQIAALLQAQQHQTVLEINLNALVHNLQVYRSKIAPATKLMVMVKAFGYGSGDAEIAKTLQYNGVDYLSVAYADEGVALRQAGVTLPIMVLNADAADFDTLEKNDLEPEVFSFDMLDALLLWCQQRGVHHHPIHIKLDTGMHRLGLEPHEVGRLADVLAGQHWLVVKSVFTHLVASEDANADYFTAAQLQKFDAACTVLEASLGYTFLKHAANTAAISRHPQAHYHMVRLGVGIYGGAPGLMPVMQLFTTVAQVKKVKAGETVGYGLEARLLHDSVIATVRIGYADGYRRSLSNGVGRMLVRGQMAPVVGRVCMDMTMLDVTHIDGVMPGDTVEVMGANISLQQLAQWCQTITYEIMTGISQRVKRIYVQE